MERKISKWTITEEPYPGAKEAEKNKKAFSPQPGSIPVTKAPPQKSLADQIKERERRQREWLISEKQ